MVIDEISIKGFKSFGNNPQTFKLNGNQGELILLTGSNGNGKSSFIESFEYVLFGKVKSMKKKKWATLSTLPNRINGELENRIKFKSNGTEVEVIRSINPNSLKLIENGIDNDKAGKSNIDEKIIDYVGMDVETFKSFISLSINDFKNFISLSTEEKQLLLDKLFNLEVINILNGILKDLIKNNKIQLTKFESEIQTLISSIDSIKSSIQNAIEKEKQNNDKKIEEIKQKIEDQKVNYLSLKEKIDKIKEKENELKSEIEREKDQYSSLNSEIKTIQRDIDLYDSGKCPTCGTDFNSDHYNNLRILLLEKKEGAQKIKNEIEENIKSLKEKETKLKNIMETTQKSYNDVVYLLKDYKNSIEKLNKEKDTNGDDNSQIYEFKKTIQDLENKKIKSEENQTKHKEKELCYKELVKVFSEEGVKKTIITGIIRPINHFIEQNIKKMSLPFHVQLDETFTATIKQFGNSIEQDSLSTGETKLININILCAYLMLIRTKKHINILFLDEIFSSIDIENITNILSLLKSFALDYNINIFVVHHAIMNQDYFDRIIRIEKDVFTNIIEEKN